MNKKIKLAVIFGGPSLEHEVSLRSAEEVINCLDKKRYEILPILIGKKGKWNKNLLKTNKVDLVIIAGHGTFMEDGQLQLILEELNIPYLFSQSAASVLAMNKHKSKVIAQKHGLTIAKSKLIKNGQKISCRKIIKELKLPIIIKPNGSGSSVGASIVHREKDFQNGLQKALKCGSEVLIEEFIAGRD